MNTLHRFLLLPVLALALSLASASPGHAQEDAARSASARAFFEEGMALADDGQWVDAVDRLRRALALRDSQVIRYNLAASLVKMGKLVEAGELLRVVMRESQGNEELQADAQHQFEIIDARIAKLTIQLEGEPEGVEVRVDELVLADVQVGVGFPIDPGVHRAIALRDGEEVDSKEATVGEGDARTVILTIPVASPKEAAAMAIGTSPTHPERSDRADDGGTNWVLWGSVAGGVVLAAVITGVAVAMAKGNSGGGTTPTTLGSVGVMVNE